MPRIQTQDIADSRDKKLVITFDTPENRTSFVAILTQEAYRQFPVGSDTRNAYDRFITAGVGFDANQLHINPSSGRGTFGVYNDRRAGRQGVAVQFRNDNLAHTFITNLGLKYLVDDPEQQAFVITYSGAAYFRQRVLHYYRSNIFDTGPLPRHVVAEGAVLAAVASGAGAAIRAVDERFRKAIEEVLEDEITLERVKHPLIHDGITFSRTILDGVRQNPKTKKDITAADPAIENTAINEVLFLFSKTPGTSQFYHELLDLLITILQRRTPDRQFKDIMLGNVVQVVLSAKELKADDARVRCLAELAAADTELRKQQDSAVIDAIRGGMAVAVDGDRPVEGEADIDRVKVKHMGFFPLLSPRGAAAADQRLAQRDEVGQQIPPHV